MRKVAMSLLEWDIILVDCLRYNINMRVEQQQNMGIGEKLIEFGKKADEFSLGVGMGLIALAPFYPPLGIIGADIVLLSGTTRGLAERL